MNHLMNESLARDVARERLRTPVWSPVDGSGRSRGRRLTMLAQAGRRSGVDE